MHYYGSLTSISASSLISVISLPTVSPQNSWYWGSWPHTEKTLLILEQGYVHKFLHTFIRITRYVVQGQISGEQRTQQDTSALCSHFSGSLYGSAGEGKRRGDNFEALLQLQKNSRMNSTVLLFQNTQIIFSLIHMWTRIYFYDALPVFICTSWRSTPTACKALRGQDMNLHRIWIYKCQRSVVVATCKSKFRKPENLTLRSADAR